MSMSALPRMLGLLCTMGVLPARVGLRAIFVVLSPLPSFHKHTVRFYYVRKQYGLGY